MFVELTPYEARALLRACEWQSDLLASIACDHSYPLPSGHTIRPLESAAMKIETSLMVAQEAID